MNLSKRMEAVVRMVSPQSFAVADVGCDHAYVSIALAKENPGRRVVAMDVRRGPLEIAAANIEEAGLEHAICLRLGDGLEKLLPGEVDTVILAGMGGLLIKQILERGRNIFVVEKPPVLVLQPQSDIWEVRIFLYNHAYHIVQENMLLEDGKFYTVIKAEPGNEKMPYTDTEYLYGAYNLNRRDEVLYRYLQKERQTLEEIQKKIKSRSVTDVCEQCGREKKRQEKKEGERSNRAQQRLREVILSLERNAEALRYYEGGTVNEV